MSTQPTLYWHDYETFGLSPAHDRPAQFAGVRTDIDLHIVGDPLVIYCQPADDYLPSPKACMVTGITPTYAYEHGVPEAVFMAQIHREIATQNTCTLGYNNIRFDDEFTRFALYRNLFDAYAREWQNGNSRWDLLEVVRLTRALRPEGINWPIDEDGSISNRLEHITAANGLSHEAAHDALSDVHATIAVARLIRDAQPRLYNYLFENRGKQPAGALLNLRERNMLVHSSGMFPNDVLNTSLIVPIAKHPVNTNAIITFDLRFDPEPLLSLGVDEIQQRVFTSAGDLGDGVDRIPLKSVHVNKCPVIASHKVLDAASADRIRLDHEECAERRARILEHIDNVAQKVTDAFAQQQFDPISDPDAALYSGGFFSAEDRRKMDQLRTLSPDQLSSHAEVFDDKRLPEMLFRYRARNYPESLVEDEFERWEQFRNERFYASENASPSMHQQFLDELQECRSDFPERGESLDDLENYAESIRP